MPTSHPSFGARLLRQVWTALSFLVATPFMTIAFTLSLAYGIFAAFWSRQRWWFALRSIVLMATSKVLILILEGSTRIYNALLGRELYAELPLPRAKKQFLIIGHRGAPTQCCENTLRAYTRALRDGANALEIDLCFTKDGEVVIWHDWDPEDPVALFRESGAEAPQMYKPCFGEGDFRRLVTKLTLSQLREHCGYVLRLGGQSADPSVLKIPTFKEFLEWAVKQKKLRTVFLDIKTPPKDALFAAPMMERIKAQWDELKPRFEGVAMSIYPDVLMAMKTAVPDFTYCLDKEFPATFQDPSPSFIQQISAMRAAENLQQRFASIGRPTFLTLSPWELYSNVIGHDLHYRHEKQLPISMVAWTVNDPMELKWLYRAGIDGILTDVPKRLATMVLRQDALKVLKSPLVLMRHRAHLKR